VRVAKGRDQAARLVERLAVFLLGIGIGDDPAANLKIHSVPEYQIGANHDAGVERAGDAEVSDRAAIDPALRRLELRDDLLTLRASVDVDDFERAAEQARRAGSAAANRAALSLYDTAKAYDRAAVISDLRLLSKSGGKSGDYQAR